MIGMPGHVSWNEGSKVAAERPHAAIELPEGSWWDWDVLAWGGDQFRLAAGFDLIYHHGLELVFTAPLLVSCPTAFQDPVFRAPTPEELHRVTQQLGGRPPVLAVFEADAGGGEPASCLVAAERLDMVRETVLRYWREDAAPGQRFAPWVQPPEQ
ncbi:MULTISPECIES: hypothetical protein [unclassified Streptomyces]|uniref:hypothetical protein n=1 Tax=unclassified Streptomyces TaxID=2593676 RepID=UPI002DD7CBC2|nr:hypothetical protein [Streptomyces sp. NBC_01237]WRZ70379.1 hypothetical protein OG251_01445 [Streptomyces sp. NBC_01237]